MSDVAQIDDVQIIARTRDGFALLEGLGVLRVGRMWVADSRHRSHYRGFAECPEFTDRDEAMKELFSGKDLMVVNIEAEAEVLLRRQA